MAQGRNTTTVGHPEENNSNEVSAEVHVQIHSGSGRGALNEPLAQGNIDHTYFIMTLILNTQYDLYGVSLKKSL